MSTKEILDVSRVTYYAFRSSEQFRAFESDELFSHGLIVCQDQRLKKIDQKRVKIAGLLKLSRRMLYSSGCAISLH
ncbi:MAG: hypothetical protein ABGW87_07795 [Sphingomonadaceae bacterium]